MAFDDGCPDGPVLVVGSVAYDSVRTPFGERTEALGGSASYASVSASFFAPVRLVAVVGEDFAPSHVERLGQRDIDLAGLQRAPGKTFRWSCYYEYDLSQAHTTATELNVFESFRPELPSNHRDTPYIFLSNIDPTLQLSVLDQMRHPKLVVCDTMNFWIENAREKLLEVLARCDVALMNDAEARQLCEEPNLIAAGRKLLNMGPGTVIIKKGEHGAVMMSHDSYFTAPGYPLEEIRDPTGAGDTFAGGLVGYLARCGKADEETLRRAVITGSVMASFTVEDFSLNRLFNLSHEEVAERYREIMAMTRFGGL
ncbi:MAG TPA: PfkB family carbohydrate kinase [Armatimonadota bacterium]|nr:PfkB family carbohydrate kinase [Armatimonadota bacterium]